VKGEGCCAKRTMSPRGPLVDTFLGTPFCCELAAVAAKRCTEEGVHQWASRRHSAFRTTKGFGFGI